MKRLLTTTSRPLKGLGLSSEIYKGTTNDALPTAAPTMDRPAIIPSTVLVHACNSAPSMKSISATRITVLRPYVSARIPVKGDARSAKNEVQDVIKLLSRVVRGREERSVFIDMSVEEITPVLRPCQYVFASTGVDALKHGTKNRNHAWIHTHIQTAAQKPQHI